MNINEVLAGKQASDANISAGQMHLEGEIQPDYKAEMFRLYPNPTKKSVYYLISRSEVRDLYKWTPEELAGAGFAGQERYRVLLGFGIIVQLVSITHHRVGEGKRPVRKSSSKQTKVEDCDCLGVSSDCPAGNPCAENCGGVQTCDQCCVS